MLTHHVKVVVKSTATSDNYGSCGTSFFIGSPRVTDSALTYLRLMVFACEYVQVTFTVRTAAGIVYSGKVFPARAVTVDLPISLTVRDSTYSNRHKGIHVASVNGYPMSVLIMAEVAVHFGEYLAHHCPPPAWQEYEYFVLSTGSQSGQKHWGLVLLVACHNDTVITITPTQAVSLPMNAQDPSTLNVTINSGDSHTITLHELQTLLAGKPESDITGTRILSNKPLSVVSGNECGTVPTHLLLCEPLQMQVPPTATWGKRFLVPPVPWREAGYMIKLVAAQNNTNLTHTCASNSSNITLSSPGESYSFMAPRHTFCSVVSSHPILVVQLGLGHYAGDYGDPSIANVPPIEHYTKVRVAVVTLNFTHYPYNFVTFLVPAEHFSSSLLFIEHMALPDIDSVDAWTAIADHNNTILGYGRVLYLHSQGTHTLHHINPLATVCATVNGFSWYTAYAYTAAVDIKPLNPGI